MVLTWSRPATVSSGYDRILVHCMLVPFAAEPIFWLEISPSLLWLFRHSSHRIGCSGSPSIYRTDYHTV